MTPVELSPPNITGTLSSYARARVRTWPDIVQTTPECAQLVQYTQRFTRTTGTSSASDRTSATIVISLPSWGKFLSSLLKGRSMTIAQINGVDIYYEVQGEGSEVILFSHGLLWSMEMFRYQINSLSKNYKVIAYDHRGQGKTEVTSSGYDMDTLTQDALALIDHLGIEKVHFVGLSMGGFVGMRMAARHPDRISSLTLIETSAEPEPEENLMSYKLLGWVARLLSIRLVAGKVMSIMFGDTFLNDTERADDRAYWKKQLLRNDRVGIHRALGGVVSRDGVVELLSQIACPTLIMVGDEDKATVPAKSDRMHKEIADSKLVTIPKAGHTSSVEQPEFVTKQLSEFLANNV